ncbi:hypothetical protein [Leptotrichia sp. oral taxon 847]|uniref:hypothetical protein n=1 Tax=Leptotrichia sp. oral taxon 847 TaxID=1785996 RepID=UPI000768285C|nr:hypothetical protein [Leptotrichia sp. oral taxon 847]AMD94409.1 hypothetical protein AXF11_01570 [Leptotrichia sp. oral taxon 847]
MKKNKIYKILLFFIISTVALSKQDDKVGKKNFKDDVVDVDIIINKDENYRNDNSNNQDNYDDDDSTSEPEDGEFIYLDQIREDEDDVKKEKSNKLNKVEKFIKKIDEKVNPILKFKVDKSYGPWYVIKTSDPQEKDFQNITYNFKQEQNGYRLSKSYLDPKNNIWEEDIKRAWIEESKGNVYLDVEKKYFKHFQNQILFFDKNYRYMVIEFSDGVTRVLSRYPNNEKISLEGEELNEFEDLLQSRSDLTNVYYDTKIFGLEQTEENRKKEALKQRTSQLEEQLKKDPSSVFQIDTKGYWKAKERERKKIKKNPKDPNNKLENVKVIEIKDGSEIKE